jgi:hypothetical protein
MTGSENTMLQYLLMSRSLTYAQRSSRLLERSGITATVTKAPPSAAGNGCAYSVKVSEKKLAQALEIMNKNALGPTKVFMLTDDGSASEVRP